MVSKNSNFNPTVCLMIVPLSQASGSYTMASCLPLSNEFLRTCILYDFKVGLKAAECHRRLCQAFGKDVISERTTREWFSKFKAGDTDVEDRPRSGRPSTADDERLLQLLEEDPRRTTREMADVLSCSHTTVKNRLHTLGKVRKQSVWVPHDLNESNRQRRVEACTSLLSLHLTTSWLDSVVTGDEKWVLYANIVRRHAWVNKREPAPTQAKAELHRRKVMLSISWDVHGVILFELLPDNTTITASVYCEQLERLKAELQRKRPQRRKIRFLQDNARPHTVKMTRNKLLELG